MSFVIHHGDALTVLRTLPSASVNCCVTSPPYWGLRDYGTPPQIWGGDSACAHVFEQSIIPAANGITHGGGMSGETLSGSSATRRPRISELCKCGAWRGSLGLEPTPELFVAHLVEVFSHVRRVLRSDGSLWLNLGDSYNNREGQRKQDGERDDVAGWKQATNIGSTNIGSRNDPKLKPKDLLGVPWRVAFALQSAGWYLRSDIIWAKPAPMPESVTDRPTRSHEHIFLLAKSERYYYDAAAIAEPAVCGWKGSSFDDERDERDTLLYPDIGKKPRPSAERGAFNGKTEAMSDTGRNAFRAVTEFRNKRDVWTVNTKPFAEAHFATFPEALIEPCILAGCPGGGTVLDPFSGAGTTGLVAKKLGRNFVGIELNPEYVAMSRRRIDSYAPLFDEVDSVASTSGSLPQQGSLLDHHTDTTSSTPQKGTL